MTIQRLTERPTRNAVVLADNYLRFGGFSLKIDFLASCTLESHKAPRWEGFMKLIPGGSLLSGHLLVWGLQGDSGRCAQTCLAIDYPGVQTSGWKGRVADGGGLWGSRNASRADHANKRLRELHWSTDHRRSSIRGSPGTAKRASRKGPMSVIGKPKKGSSVFYENELNGYALEANNATFPPYKFLRFQTIISKRS